MLEDPSLKFINVGDDIAVGRHIHSAEEQYLSIMREILDDAQVDPDRTGDGRARVFGRDIRVNISDGTLPIVTTRKINYEHGIEELLWMIRGSSNVNDLPDSAKPIWRDWAVEEKHIDAFLNKMFPGVPDTALETSKKRLLDKFQGSIGPMYGHFWRQNEAVDETPYFPLESLDIKDIPSDKLDLFKRRHDIAVMQHNEALGNLKAQGKDISSLPELPSLETSLKVQYFQENDQLGELMRGLKRRPYSARHIITAWNPTLLPFEGVYSPQENVLVGRGALAACHAFMQFFVKKARDGGPDHLSLRLTQRSCDLALGVCTNLVEYATFLHLVAHCAGFRPAELIWSGGDVHLYGHHLETAREQIKRTPFPPPTIRINPDQRDIFQIKRSDIEVLNYQHHEPLRYKVSV